MHDEVVRGGVDRILALGVARSVRHRDDNTRAGHLRQSRVGGDVLDVTESGGHSGVGPSGVFLQRIELGGKFVPVGRNFSALAWALRTRSESLVLSVTWS
ncbi:hypothetical protein GCM10020255_040170 [Rhodococcus baikonurensis]